MLFHGKAVKYSRIALIMVNHPHNFPPFSIFKASSSFQQLHVMRKIFSWKVFIVLPCFDFYLVRTWHVSIHEFLGVHQSVYVHVSVYVWVLKRVCLSVSSPGHQGPSGRSDELSPNLFFNLQKLLKSLSVSGNHLELKETERGREMREEWGTMFSNLSFAVLLITSQVYT